MYAKLDAIINIWKILNVFKLSYRLFFANAVLREVS
jgi:hypothetical protein